MKYCPLIHDELHTSVVGVGQIGVWRITQLNFIDDNSVHNEIEAEEQFQPELHDFYITEISQGIQVIVPPKCMQPLYISIYKFRYNSIPIECNIPAGGSMLRKNFL